MTLRLTQGHTEFTECMKAIDWTKIYKKYKGLWVGLKDDEKTVISSGKTAKEVMQKSQKKGYKEPILFRVPTEIIPYIGCINDI